MNRLLRGLLLLYPASHRRTYGDEILSAARHRCSGEGATVSVKLGVVADVALGAVGVWVDRMSGQIDRMKGQTDGGRGSVDRTAAWIDGTRTDGRTSGHSRRKKMRKMETGTAGLTGGWLLDLRFVLRSLWRSRSYVATTVVVLSCSVAATATVFSFVRGTLLDEPPWPEPDRILMIWGSNVEDGQLRDVISGPGYIELQRRTTTFDHIGAFHHGAAYLMVDGRPEVLDAIEVSADFFGVLDVRPAHGRLFGEEDRTSGAPATVVVTHQFWQDRLGGDPEAVGTTLPFEGEARTVIGVLPRGFEFVTPAPLFIPLRDDVLAADDPGRIHYNVLARLSPGAGLGDASADMARAAAAFTDVYRGFDGWTFRAERLHDVTVESVRPVIWALAGTVCLVLLVALVNLATLFRIRALARRAELGVRIALGAGRTRIVRILALETVLLSATGAGLGLAATPFLLARIGEIVPEWIAIPESASRVPVLQSVLDPSVALAAFGVAVLGALTLTVPGALSALRQRSFRGSRGVHEGTAGTRALVGVEVAVATALCVGAALLVRSAHHLLSVDVGLEHEDLLTFYYGDVWGEEPAERTAFYRETVEAVVALPGVRAAGVIDYVDFQAEDDFARIYFLDRSFQPTRDVREEWRRVDQWLFDAAGMRIVAGRGFRSDDMAGTPRAAVVNEAFAEKHWPDRSPLGALLSTHDTTYRDMEVVGVVADVRSLGPAAPPPPMLYVPLQGNARGTMGMYVRVDGDPMGHASDLREAIWSIDSSQPIAGVWPMSAFVETWVAIPKAARALVLALAGLALLLAAVGVFGVVSYVVRTRRSELGVRLALGATPDRLERDQMRTMLGVVGLAVGAGLAGGILAARAAGGLLHGVQPLDPVSVSAAAAAMGVAALLASYLPARRIGRIDPSEAMRLE